MLKIEDVIKDLNDLDEATFAQLSDKLWELGNLDDIKAIVPEKRREMVKAMRQKISLLEELTEQHWSDNSEMGGWKQVFDYIHKKVLL